MRFGRSAEHRSQKLHNDPNHRTQYRYQHNREQQVQDKSEHQIETKKGEAADATSPLKTRTAEDVCQLRLLLLLLCGASGRLVDGINFGAQLGQHVF